MVLGLETKGYHLTNRFLLRWKFWSIVSLPVLLLPIAIIPHFALEARCAYILAIVTLFWVFNLIPLAVTALLPVGLVPLMGIASSGQITPPYMKEINILLIGTVITAIAIEYCNLHRRIALKTLITLGTSPRWLLLGFMITSAFLSMWLNNTSTTALMTPIADSVLVELFPFDAVVEGEENNQAIPAGVDPAVFKFARSLRNAVMVSIFQSSLLGGTMTLTGTGTNLVLMAALDAEYEEEEVRMNYMTWMLFNVPNGIVCILVGWLVIQLFFFGFRRTFGRQATVSDTDKRLKALVKKKYLELGPMTYHEKTILILFVLLVLCWITRDPGFTKGWLKLFNFKKKIKDSACACFIIALMFILPATHDWWWSDTSVRSLDPAPPTCLTWKVVHARFSWSVLLLMGGGFAIAEACKVSGLSVWIGQSLMGLQGMPSLTLIILVCLASVFLTSFLSNVATSTILLPVLISVSNATRIPPLLLLIPCTVSCSFAFLFPISSPPNAIAFEKAKISIWKMALVGICQTFMCLVISIIFLYTYAPVLFNMSKHPND